MTQAKTTGHQLAKSHQEAARRSAEIRPARWEDQTLDPHDGHGPAPDSRSPSEWVASEGTLIRMLCRHYGWMTIQPGQLVKHKLARTAAAPAPAEPPPPPPAPALSIRDQARELARLKTNRPGRGLAEPAATGHQLGRPEVAA